MRRMHALNSRRERDTSMRADILIQGSSTQGAASANFKRKKCVETDQGLRSSAAKSVCFDPKILATSQKGI